MQSAKKARAPLGVTQSVHGKSDSLISTQLTRLLQWPCAAGFPGGTSSSVPAGTITAGRHAMRGESGNCNCRRSAARSFSPPGGRNV